VAHTYNSSYSGGRDQEDFGWANSSRDAISKNTHYKNRAGGVAQGVGPEFKPQYVKKQKPSLMLDFRLSVRLVDRLSGCKGTSKPKLKARNKECGVIYQSLDSHSENIA
jgi:hypothetical protein